MFEDLIQAFIKEHQLSATLHAPLAELIRASIQNLAVPLDSKIQQALSFEEEWKPVALVGSPTSDLPSSPDNLVIGESNESFESLDSPQPTQHKLDAAPTLLHGDDIRLFQPEAHPPQENVYRTIENLDISSIIRPLESTPTLPEGFSFMPQKAKEHVEHPAELSAYQTVGPELFSDVQPAAEVTDAHVTALVSSEWQRDVFISSRTVRQFEKLCLIGTGGMSEVWRVIDPELNRTMAMKIMREEVGLTPTLLARFIEEAQVTAQLSHPGIVPILECGQLLDGRFYFTMKELPGQTLHNVIQEVHSSIQDGHWTLSENGWNIHRLLDTFKRICDAVGYAHSHRVLHRDLKPDNIIVGQHGEVWVVDWGLVKILPPLSEEDGELNDWKQTANDQQDEPLTMQGDIIGTPAYMPPEQMLSPKEVNERSDVYALGSILYEILSGQAPYVGYNNSNILFQMLSGAPYPPGRTERTYRTLTESEEETESFWRNSQEMPSYSTQKPPLPEGLLEICAKALQRTPEDRYPHAGELAKELGAWLDGSKKNQRAQDLVSEAKEKEPEIILLRSRAQEMRKTARQHSQRFEIWAPEEHKWSVWEIEDEADGLEAQANLLDFESEQLLQSALTHAPDLEAAHISLAERYKEEHQHAERSQDTQRAFHAKFQLQQHIAALPTHNTHRKLYTDYLQGDGLLSLHTQPIGASVTLYKVVEVQRRFQERLIHSLGQTPLIRIPLPMGSYVLHIQAPGYEDVRYPVHIQRGQHWDHVHPHTQKVQTLHLPPKGTLDTNECYIPCGPFWAGGDREHPDALPGQQIWMHDFVIQKNPVTNELYQIFIDELRASGREEEAQHYAPHGLQGSHSEETPPPFYESLMTGAWSLTDESDEPIWPAQWPVVKISWFAAHAFSQWYAKRTQQPWRLAFELEWEKAARGVDGRFYPWGNFADPSWCCMRDSQGGTLSPCSIREYPMDTSVYGVRHMAGNAADWCLDAHRQTGPIIHEGVFLPHEAWEQSLPHTPSESPLSVRRLRRGGGWNSHGVALKTTHRHWSSPAFHFGLVGFRLVRPYKAVPS